MWFTILKSELVQQGGATGLFLPEKLNLPSRRDCCKEARDKLQSLPPFHSRFTEMNCEGLYHILWYAVERDTDLERDNPSRKTLLSEIKDYWDECDGGEASKNNDALLDRANELIFEYPFDASYR